MVAAVLVMSANQFSTLGLGQFLIAKPDAGRAAAFHATAFHVLLGAIALLALLLLGSRLGPALEAPRLTAFLPGLVLSAFLDRVAFVPERILVRDVRFGTIGAARTAGDLAFSVLSVVLAAAGWGASALVLGNVARSFVRLVWFVAVVERRDWFEPSRLSLRQTRELLAFGVPMSAGALCAFAARRWDNLLVSRFFGAGTTGMYNLAYNLADVPAIQVGEQIGDVLLPSFARMEVARRPSALVRSHHVARHRGLSAGHRSGLGRSHADCGVVRCSLAARRPHARLALGALRHAAHWLDHRFLPASTTDAPRDHGARVLQARRPFARSAYAWEDRTAVGVYRRGAGFCSSRVCVALGGAAHRRHSAPAHAGQPRPGAGGLCADGRRGSRRALAPRLVGRRAHPRPTHPRDVGRRPRLPRWRSGYSRATNLASSSRG